MVGIKVINGIKFPDDAPEEIARHIAYYCGKGIRVRLFYGDRKTGKDWGEVYDTMGYISKSYDGTPNGGIPILVLTSRSMGGRSILFNSIVRMTVDKQDVYRHPKYNCKVSVSGGDVYFNGQIHSRYETRARAEQFAKFLRGDSNKI